MYISRNVEVTLNIYTRMSDSKIMGMREPNHDMHFRKQNISATSTVTDIL